ncbi:GntR family transcriptional regulator [Paenibacillus glycanilyticus]|uniref:GntR family transcriptional regulator n=1 Tax=Paenibacillus glycanilyticus TaxID=126569 RepID=A0ABQ6NG65_9BACL|nr:GntR family transcriptional regulator [Paenibacillus glycanilyticus]GMK43177.1 GntR family transcriptional regulator [Paenibacillus glycanilyticus]
MSGVTLKEKAFIHLRNLILNGELKPGEVLTERLLVEMLEMSRTPIRAALERLDAEGLANYTPNKGLIVAELSLRKAIDLYDYRIAMECFVVRRLAAMELENSDIRWFEQNLREQQVYVDNSDYGLFTEADSQFHRKLAELYANSEILQAMERLQDQLYRIAISVLRKDRTRIGVSYNDHLRIFQFIQEGDAEKASQAMEEHLEFGKRILIM